MIDRSFLTKARFQVDPAVFTNIQLDSSSNSSSSAIYPIHNCNELPDNFVPAPMDVIAGRGKICFSHPGNIRFKEIISSNLARYTRTKTKMDKSIVVNEIVDEIREMSPSGGFVKKVQGGKWKVLDDVTAREKVGHAIRDALSSAANNKNRQYKTVPDFEHSRSLLDSQRAFFLMFQEARSGSTNLCSQEDQRLTRTLSQAQTVPESEDESSDCSLGTEEPIQFSTFEDIHIKHSSLLDSQMLFFNSFSNDEKNTKKRRSAVTMTAKSA